MGDPMTEYSNEALQESAHRHLWMHFTRMSDDTAPGDPGHRPTARASWVYDQHGKRYLDGLSGLFTSQLGHGRMELVEAGAEQAAKLAYFPVWSYAHPKAVELAEKIAEPHPGRPQPDLLHHRRLRGGRVGVEAGPPVLQADRPARALQGHQPEHRLPRRHHGRPVDHRGHRDPHAVRAPGSRAPSRSPTPTSTGPPTSRTTRRPSAAGPPTPSSRRSWPRTPRRWPPCSWSRCRTPAAASRRRPATSSGCARSATGTASCSSPTRSSAPGAGSATSSASERYDYVPDMITMAKGLTSGYSPLGRPGRERPADRAVPRRVELPARHHLRRPPGQRGGGAGQHRRLREGGDPGERPRARGRVQGLPRHARATCPSWATSAVPGTSTASRWSRTRTPRRPSTTTRPSACCAASSPAPSTSRASSAGPTTGATRSSSWPRRSPAGPRSSTYITDPAARRPHRGVEADLTPPSGERYRRLSLWWDGLPGPIAVPAAAGRRHSRWTWPSSAAGSPGCGPPTT